MDALSTPRLPSAPHQQADATPTTDFALIESQKENIRPLASGRSAATLSNVFDKNAEAEQAVQQGHERHRQMIEEAERRDREGEEMVEGVDDVLDAYNKYILFTIQHHPSSPQHIIPLLESTTRRFLGDARYTQDVRNLKFWVSFSRYVERREEIWAFLASREVGTKHSLFYEEWASAVEGLGRKKKADEIYRLGIARKATPLERLKSRHQAFLARIMAPPSGVVPDDDPSIPLQTPSRSVLGSVESAPTSLSGATAQLAPSNRLSRAPNGAKMEVFSDAQGSSSEGEASEWADFGTRESRRKENTIEAGPWKGETLPQKRGMTPRTPKLEVFRDSDENQAVRAADEVFGRLRPPQTEAELLRADPLRHYDTTELSTSVPALPSLPLPPSARKPPRAKPASSTSHFVMQPWECPTDGAEIKDAKGKTERRMFAWDAVFRGQEEWSFEEIRAKERGMFGKEWRGDIKSWERAWHEPGSSTPKAKAPAKKPPSPTVNTKLANEEVARMFDQTIHGGRLRDSDDESDDSFEEDHDDPPVPMAPASSSAHAMLAPRASLVPPTPSPMVFADENAGIGQSASNPGRFNIFSETPAKAPLNAKTPSTAGSDGKPKSFGVFQEPSSTGPAVRARLSFGANPFATPAASQSSASRQAVAETINEEPEEAVASDFTDAGEELGGDEAIEDDQRRENEMQEEYEDEEEEVPQRGREMRRLGFVAAMTPITEMTYEFTQMTNFGRSSFSGTSTRRTSAASTAAGDEGFALSDGNNVTGLAAVSEEEGQVGDASRRSVRTSGGKSSFDSPAPGDRSGSIGSGFHLPDGYTIHGRHVDHTTSGHTMTIVDAQETMHTARESSPDVDTNDFVTANHHSPEDLPNPCNPIDDDVLATLLDLVDPPLTTLSGFVDRRGHTSKRLEAIQKFAKNKVRRNTSNADMSRMSLAPEEVYSLDLAGKPYEVVDKIGEGGYGAVFLAVDVEARQEQDDADSDDEDENESSANCMVAIKVEKPAAIWEAVVLDRVHRRIRQEARSSIIQPRTLHAFADESFLILDYASQGTLLDAVNKASSMGIAPAVSGGPSAFDELLAIFFTIELLRVVETLHEADFIHGDLKIDNCLIRLEEVSNADWSQQYSRTGEEGWSKKGINLIDFGRGVDLSIFPAGRKQQFIADWDVDERDCIEMRQSRPWSYQTDYHGLASVCYCMLYGKYIATEEISGQPGRYKIDTPMRRYWQTELWNDLFDTLLNSTSVRPDGQLPITSELAVLRGRFEDWLEENCQKGGKSLRAMLKKIELKAITSRNS